MLAAQPGCGNGGQGCLVQPLLQRYGTQLLLLCTVIATVGFAFPCLVWATYIGYALIALLLTQMMVESSKALNTSDALYRGLGLISEMVMSALETIQPGSFKPVDMANVGDSSVLSSARLFSAINYNAFASPPLVSGTSARCSPQKRW